MNLSRKALRPLILWLQIVVLNMYYQECLVWTRVNDVTRAFKIVHQFQDHALGLEQQVNNPFRLKSIKKDLTKFYHPDTVLEDYYMFRETGPYCSLREHIQKHYFDSQPNNHYQPERVKSPNLRSLSKFTSQYLLKFMWSRFNGYTKLGFFERTQHMPTPESSLFDKMEIAMHLNQRIRNLTAQGKSQQCLRDAQFQSKSYILDEPEDCEQFFAKANIQYSVPDIEVYPYVKKNNSHNQKGTELAYKAVFHQIAQKYDYGKNCSQTKKHHLIMQALIDKPLTLDSRKFDIRMHMIIASTNPPIMYLYKKIYYMKCQYPFDHKEFKNQSHICNAGYSRRLIKTLEKAKNKTELEIILPVSDITEVVSYVELGRRLKAEGKIENESWIDEYMIPEMEKRFHHYYQSYIAQHGHINDTRFGLYTACDINIDDQMNFYLLECTTNPNMVPGKAMNPLRRFLMGLHKEAMPLIIAYSRAKYIRIKKLITDYIIPLQKQYRGESLYQKRYEEVQPHIEQAMQEEPLSGPFDQFFHRIDFERAQKSCN